MQFHKPIIIFFSQQAMFFEGNISTTFTNLSIQIQRLQASASNPTNLFILCFSRIILSASEPFMFAVYLIACVRTMLLFFICVKSLCWFSDLDKKHLLLCVFTQTRVLSVQLGLLRGAMFSNYVNAQ